MKISKRKVECRLADSSMSLAQLAENAGMKRPQLSAILNRGTCTTKNAGRIADALQVPVFEIMSE